MKKTLLITVKLIITALVVWWVFHGLEKSGQLAALGGKIRQVDPWGLAMGLGFVFFTMGLGICRWQCLLRVQGIRISNYQATWIIAVGAFFNAFMIGATGGDVLKAWYAAQAAPEHKPQAVFSVLVDRLIGLLGLFLLASFCVLLNWSVLMSHPKTRPVALLMIGSLLATIAAAVLSTQRHRLAARPWWRRLEQWLPAKKLRHQLSESYDLYGRHPRTLVVTLVLSVGVHISTVLAAWCIGRAIPLKGVTLVHYFVYCPIINAFAALPATLGGLGLREEAYKFFFSLQSVPDAEAVALSLLFYASTLVLSLVCGVFYLVGKPATFGLRPLPATATPA